MVIDTSALIAILRAEPESQSLAHALEAADARHLSAVSYVEASMVIDARQGAEGLRRLDRLIAAAGIEIVPVDRAQAEAARDGWRRFGKGRHPAGLNLGDCFAYALAQERHEPLLFKGEDFSRTDVVAALPAAGRVQDSD